MKGNQQENEVCNLRSIQVTQVACQIKHHPFTFDDDLENISLTVCCFCMFNL